MYTSSIEYGIRIHLGAGKFKTSLPRLLTAKGNVRVIPPAITGITAVALTRQDGR